MKDLSIIKLTRLLQEFPDMDSFIEHLTEFKESLSKVESVCEEVLEENRCLKIQLLDVSMKYKEMELKLKQIKSNGK